MRFRTYIAAALVAVMALGVAPALADTTTTVTTTTTTTPAPVVTPPPAVVVPPPVAYVPPPVVAPRPAVYTVNLPWGEWLNLRSVPNGPVIGSMPPGTPLTLVGPVLGNWGYVATPMGYTGYAFLPYTMRVA